MSIDRGENPCLSQYKLICEDKRSNYFSYVEKKKYDSKLDR